MPFKLKRLDGSVTPFRNSEYLPFYYLIPRSILQKCGAELNSIPRNPRMVFANREACEFKIIVKFAYDIFGFPIVNRVAPHAFLGTGVNCLQHCLRYSGEFNLFSQDS